MTTPELAQPTATTCCGEQRAGKWLPREGEPQVPACRLCKRSGRYWRGNTDQLAPTIYVVLPGLEDFETVARLLMAAGAQSTARRREFAITGPLTPLQAAATWDIATHWDSEKQIGARVDPPIGLSDALLLLCPQGWGEVDTHAVVEDYALDTDRWWREQMDRQAELRKQA